MNILLDMWNTNGDYTLWQSIWISSILFLMNSALCVVTWLMHREAIIVCGYAKSQQKKIRRAIKTWPIMTRITLLKLANQTTTSNPMNWLCAALNQLNIIAILTCFVGYIGAIVSRGNGWAMTLVLCSGFFSFCISGAVHSVGTLLWVPSERKRWRK